MRTLAMSAFAAVLLLFAAAAAGMAGSTEVEANVFNKRSKTIALNTSAADLNH